MAIAAASTAYESIGNGEFVSSGEVAEQWRLKLSTTTSEDDATVFDPIHPGEDLAEFIEEVGISEERFAKEIGVPVIHAREILSGQRPITVDVAKSIGSVLNTSAILWLRLQYSYDLEVAHGRAEIEWIDEIRAMTVEDFERVDQARLAAHASV